MPPSVGALLLLSLLTPQSPPAAHDTLLDAGGYAMHLVLHRGSQPITVVMESGGGDDVQGWAGVDSALAGRTGATVVAYDRAGFGRSGTGPADLTPRKQIRQLHEALERLGTPPARIVVGTSYGGMMALLHAHLYPGNVRGLVLADPMNSRFVRATGDFVSSTVQRIEQPVTSRDSALARMVRTFPAFVRDPAAGDGDLRIPIVVITAGTPWWGKPDIERAWRASHEAIVAAGPDRRLAVAEGSRHLIAKERPETIVDGVVSLMAVRASSPTLRVVRPYLEALARLDHDAMAALWAPDVVNVDADGETYPVQPAFARDMRAYERAARTRWGYTIDSVQGDSAFVTLTESNEFYDLLGVGPRTQRVIYVASGGRIRIMRGLTLEHPGGDFDSIYTAFKRWVIDTAAVRDSVLLGDGVLRFTAESAEPMRRWLRAWRQRGTSLE